MTKKNILIITGLDSSLKMGGIERWYINLAKIVDKESRIFLFYNKELPTDFIVNSFESHHIYSSVFAFNEIKNRREEFRKFLTNHQIKVVWSHFENTLQFLPYAKKMGLITLWTLHMGNYYYTNKQWTTNFKLFIGVILFRIKIFRNIFYIDKIYCVSDGVRKEFKNFFGHRNKFEVNYLGFEKNFLEDNLKEWKKRNKLKEKLVISSVAFHGRIKGVDIYIRAIAELNKRGYENIMYYQIGCGQYLDRNNDTAELKELAMNLNIKNLCWKGLQREVLPFLLDSDVYCQPSRHEAMPFSIMEAMSVGLPIVAPNIGGIPELVQDNANGLLFKVENYLDLADKIEILIKNRDLREKMGEHSLAVIHQDRFQSENNIKKILKDICW